MKKESQFQAELVKEIKHILPGSVVLITDPARMQGILDLLILHKDRWAALEVKRTATASKRPNQEYYVEKFNDMSYAAFIYPENKDQILNEIQQTFGS